MKHRPFIGVMSDTHGQLRPEVVADFQGADLIIHAGDVGSESIIDQLENIAPLKVVRGNVDAYGWCSTLPGIEAFECWGHSFYMLHSRDWLDLSPSSAGFDVVVFGHSHKPVVEEHLGVLYFNPGSCGPRRFDLPISYAKLYLEENGKLGYEFFEIEKG